MSEESKCKQEANVSCLQPLYQTEKNSIKIRTKRSTESPISYKKGVFVLLPRGFCKSLAKQRGSSHLSGWLFSRYLLLSDSFPRLNETSLAQQHRRRSTWFRVAYRAQHLCFILSPSHIGLFRNNDSTNVDFWPVASPLAWTVVRGCWWWRQWCCFCDANNSSELRVGRAATEQSQRVLTFQSGQKQKWEMGPVWPAGGAAQRLPAATRQRNHSRTLQSPSD